MLSVSCVNANAVIFDCSFFEIKKPKYNKETIQAMEDTKNGKNLSKAFDNVEEMFKELEK